ncbi:MAG: DUF3341 domain-containing protein [Deltaproteobacteria bacterium]|nr:DUF3341 domain-containing protein [Deltaproteobacteria bacterium]
MEIKNRQNEQPSTNKNLVVLGIFDSRTSVEGAVDNLKSEGFRSADISALFPSGDSNKEFAHEKATKLPEGTTTGTASGLVLGGTLGWLIGVGALAIPGLGAFIAAGPIMSMLAGAGVGGAVGGLTGALIGLGIPEYEAKRYEGQIKNGGILISVHCDNEEWSDRAKEILKRTGARDISSTSEASADYDKSNRPYSKSANF